jgi:hypothetical protein
LQKTEEKKSTKRKSNIRLGKETYGTMPIDECFKKAFEPYFNPEKQKEYYLDRLGT